MVEQLPGQTDLYDFVGSDVTMYDAIKAEHVPGGAAAVAGYVDGAWPSYGPMRARFPRARHVSITVFGALHAEIADCERGDLTPEMAIRWVVMQRERGVYDPGIYASLLTWPDLLERLAFEKLERRHFRVWTAHWTGVPHRCNGDCHPDFTTEAGATQYASTALFDVSLARRAFFLQS